MHELPLVFFTVFGQSAVGLFIFAFLGFQLSLNTWQQLKRAYLVALVLMAVGLVIGMVHLGQIFRAANMLAGLGRSPMSNEIVLCGAFFALVCATNFFLYIKPSAGLANVCIIAGILVGLAFAWSITQVYQLATVAAWNTTHTSLQMWLTVLLGGGACAMLSGIRKAGGMALLVGALLSIVTKPDYFSFVNHIDPLLSANQTLFWTIQCICLGLAIAVGVAALLMRRESMCSPLILASAGFVVVGELASRIAFYNLWAMPM